MSYTKIAGGIAVVAVIVLLLSWNRIMGVDAKTWEGTHVACLSGGHQNAGQHIHQRLSITVDGVPEVIPANIGVNPTCMAEVHTHDVSGELHVETIEADKRYSLGDFFVVWGKEFERPGYMLTMRLNGVENTAGASLILKDGQRIELEYKAEGSGGTTTESIDDLFNETEGSGGTSGGQPRLD